MNIDLCLKWDHVSVVGFGRVIGFVTRVEISKRSEGII